MNKTLGDRIKEEREKKNLTQAQLGKLTNTSTGFLCDVENGKRGIEVNRLARIAKTLNVSIDYLFSGVDSGETNLQSTLLDAYAQAALTGLLSNSSLITSISWDAYVNNTENKLQQTLIGASFNFAQLAIKTRKELK